MIPKIQTNRYVVTFDKPIRATLFGNKLKKLDILFVRESKTQVLFFDKEVSIEVVKALPDLEHFTIEKKNEHTT